MVRTSSLSCGPRKAWHTRRPTCHRDLDSFTDWGKWSTRSASWGCNSRSELTTSCFAWTYLERWTRVRWQAEALGAVTGGGVLAADGEIVLNEAAQQLRGG